VKAAVKTMNTRTDRRGKLAPRRLGLRASPSGPQLAPRNSPPRLGRRSGSAGTEGNEILTSAAAVVLVCLLAAEGITIVHMRGLLSAHMFIGLVLIGPVLLKLGSTGYRMVRYYSGSRPYRVKGPPALPLRALALVLVASTIAVLASGVLLLAAGHKSRTLVTIHKVSSSYSVWSWRSTFLRTSRASRAPYKPTGPQRAGMPCPGRARERCWSPPRSAAVRHSR
jgi:hypothetical protein